MNKRTIMAVAAGVVAGATLMGVPAFALADARTDTGTASDMTAVMEDPEFVERMAAVMSEVMSDEELQGQMRSMMSNMGGMSMDGMGDAAEEESAPGTP